MRDEGRRKPAVAATANINVAAGPQERERHGLSRPPCEVCQADVRNGP
jgi:hypothetical protein